MKFYETVLFMSRCSPSPKLTKQQQLWPAPPKSKDKVKWFSGLAGFSYRILCCSDLSFDHGDRESWPILSMNAGLCIILFTSLWWQVWTVKCDVCAAWISYSVVLLRVCQYEICGCQCGRRTLSIWSSGLQEKCAWLIFQAKINFCLFERLSYF